jgi:HEAT repeat protein
MSRRASAARRSLRVGALGLALAAIVLPALASAQVPLDQDQPRSRFRDRYKTPQNSQKLDENVRKLNSDDPAERIEAIRGLGEVNDPKATDYLIAAASDTDMRIRIKAIDTLGNVKAKDATPLLIQQLFMRDTDVPTKQRLLASLGKIGDSRATSPIVDFLSRDVDPATRGTAIFALGEIGDRAALPALDALVKDERDEMLRGIAQEAARKIRDKPVPTVVPPALAVRQPGAPGGAPGNP